MSDAVKWRPEAGMVLAAGLGVRMRPLTDTVPKPLVRLKGRALIDHVLDRLAAAGVARAVVNVHYLADKLESHLSQRKRPQIVVSDERGAVLEKLVPLHGPSAFTGAAPGGPSRWSKGRSSEWVPLRPELVAEVVYDQVTGARFRHGTTFLRWRPDKAPRQCTMDQLGHELRPAVLAEVLEEAG